VQLALFAGAHEIEVQTCLHLKRKVTVPPLFVLPAREAPPPYRMPLEAP
jgi:hypothetical protein